MSATTGAVVQGILPVTRIARELLSVDGYGSHHTLLAARFVVRAPEGWICQRSGRVPWLVPLVTQTLLSRTRPCLRVYCKTAKPPRASPSTFQSTAAASMVTILFRSRSKNMSKEDLRLCLVECAPASLSPASSSLTHARRMDGFCNQNADQFGSLAGPSLLTVYVGVVECAPASPYTYSSSTHRFPDERTPIEATPLSATSAELGLGLGLGLGLDSLSHSSSHVLPFFSPPSFHTLSLFPAFTSVWWSG
jgi:hypothetical protein